MQVGKAYFELVDYLEAARVFSLSRRASPYSLEGLDIYSTVLYVSSVDPFSSGSYVNNNIAVLILTPSVPLMGKEAEMLYNWNWFMMSLLAH